MIPTNDPNPEFGQDSAAGTDSSASADPVIAELQGQIQAEKENALRAHAELENFRKRMRREMDDDRKYSNVQLLQDLLPTLDNLERAIAAGGSSGGPVVDGVKLVLEQTRAVLAKHKCVRIESLGQAFDPNFHQAIGQQPGGDKPSGTILIVAQEGYKVHERVLRPAQVIIAQ